MAVDRDALCGYQPELADAITGTTSRRWRGVCPKFDSTQVTLTTANFPDVMLPAYERNRWPPHWWFPRLGMFFMMNLLLATVYNTYSEKRAATH